jgi:hypothetical protein
MNEQVESPPVSKRPTQRSPSYPAIGLADALERAGVLYTEEGRNAAPVEAVVSHWGYGAKSSGGRLVLAALRRYGLLEDEKHGSHTQVKLSRLALDIILGEDGPKKAEAIQLAALAPPINRELIEKHPDGLPSDQSLRHYLVVERGFTNGAAEEFIPRLRDTIAFAELGRDATLSPDGRDKDTAPPTDNGTTQGGRSVTFPAVAPPPARASQESGAPLPVNVNLPGGGWATLNVSRQVSGAEWQTILAVLNASKPGLTTPDE